MSQNKDSDTKKQSLARFRWVIGTPYFVQGTSSLTEVPILYFIKFALGMGEAGGQLFDSLRQLGWFIKPVWGYISDRVPLLGYHRKSWYVLMAFLAVVFWLLNALLAYLGIQIPLLYLITFNLAFATYAFVDVVCDALMVGRGRETDQVGSLINFQWAVLAVANAGSVYLGGWFQGQIREGIYEPWLVFLLTGAPPLVTAVVGIRNIQENPVSGWQKRKEKREKQSYPLKERLKSLTGKIGRIPEKFRKVRRKNRPVWLLVLFIFFWKFSPSIGFIERSYLIDKRDFSAESFGIILSAGGITFLLSVLAYSWVVNRFPGIRWHYYLYAMVALGVITFPLSFYLYLNPDHTWWDFIYFRAPDWINPFPSWNRYQWFRLIFQTTLGFATIPAFIIPLTIAGETISLSSAGVSYALLMSLSNVTNMFEGVVGAWLYDFFSSSKMAWLLTGFKNSWLNIANTADERTLILQMFVYISLLFTVLTIPFIELLRRELQRRGINIKLGRRNP